MTGQSNNKNMLLKGAGGRGWLQPPPPLAWPIGVKMFLLNQLSAEVEPVQHVRGCSRVWHWLYVPLPPPPGLPSSTAEHFPVLTRFPALIFPRLKPQDLIGLDSCPVITNTLLVHVLDSKVFVSATLYISVLILILILIQRFYSRNVTSQTCHSSLSAVWFAAHRWLGSKRPKIMLFRLVTQILEKCKVWTDAIDCELRPTFILTKACDSSRGWDKCILPCTEMQRFLVEWWRKWTICWRITKLQRWAYFCECSCSHLLASAGAK